MDGPNSTADRRNLWLVDSPFMAQVEFSDTGCWVWQGAKDNGYGRVFRAGHNWMAHRWAYFKVFGDLDPDLHLDHLCRNPPCVNPDHLEPVTNLENQERSPNWTGNRTHCARGHPYDAANTYIRPSTKQRVCRKCRDASRRKSKERRSKTP